MCNLILSISLLILFLLIFGCNGGGGGDDDDDRYGGVYSCTSQKDYHNSSYELQKTCLHICQYAVRETIPVGWASARAYADFDNDGNEDILFASVGETEEPTAFEMYLSDGLGNFKLDNSILLAKFQKPSMLEKC